jgi:hypothetical protein
VQVVHATDEEVVTERVMVHGQLVNVTVVGVVTVTVEEPWLMTVALGQ